MRMKEINLTPEERNALQALLEARRHPGVYRHRAEILLAYDDGLLTTDIARRLNISPRLARYWKHTFQEKGMAIFSDAEEGAAPLEPAQALPPEEGAKAAPPETPPPPPAVKKAKAPKGPGITGSDEAFAAGIKLFRYLFDQMLENEEGTRHGDDIEALHDMRVATRRLRAAFEVFSPYFPAKVLKPFRRNVRDIGRALGSVRDLDVFLEKTNAFLETPGAPLAESIAPLLDYYAAQRDELRSALILLLDRESTRQFIDEFQAYLAEAGQRPAGQTGAASQAQRICQIAPILIYTRLADVRGFESGLENASIERLHALRTAFKYFRYTLEFFREALGEEVRPSIEALKRIQDHLGDLNDANVACGLINTFLSAWELRQDSLPLSERQNPEGVIACLAGRSRERHALLTDFPLAWQQFDRPEFRRLIAGAVSGL